MSRFAQCRRRREEGGASSGKEGEGVRGLPPLCPFHAKGTCYASLSVVRLG
jgi:hypothetical protein